MSSFLAITLLLLVGKTEEEFSEPIECINSYRCLDSDIVSVKSATPLTWSEMQQLCWDEHTGYGISLQFSGFSTEVEAMCPVGCLVPLGIVKVDGIFRWNGVEGRGSEVTPENLTMLMNPDLNASGNWGALRWPTTELVIVGNETKFNCAICKMADRVDANTRGVYPPHNNSIYAYDLELVSYDRIDDIHSAANGSELTNKLLDDLAKAFNISVKSLHWHGATLNGDRKAVVHVYYNRGDVDMDWLYYAHWNDPYLDRKSVDNFEIKMIKLNTECPLLDSKSASHLSLHNKPILTGSLNQVLHIDRMQVILRECFWDPNTESAVWSPPFTWTMTWGHCDKGKTLGLQMLSLKGPEMTVALKNFDFQVVLFLSESKRKAFMEFIHDYKTLVNLANLEILAHTTSNVRTAFTILENSVALNLGKVYILFPFEAGSTSVLIHTKFVNVLAADHNAENPVVGMAVTLHDGTSDTTPTVTQLNHSDMALKLTGSHLVVTVSDSIAFSAKRLAIVTYAAHLEVPNHANNYDDSFDSWMALVQVTFTRTDPNVVGTNEDFIDLAFKPVFRWSTQRGKCAERLFGSDEWFGDSCRILRSMRDNLLVCRCQKLFVDDIFTSSTYLIYGFDASLSTFLANNKTLVIVTVFVSAMSVLGLLSVVATAIRFPDWRKDQGHQIFLQMISALTVNLVLGYVNNFISIDTKSVLCIAIGAIKHYSFLAMFCWMMILSGLQVRRLMTIAGSKTTSHLILKVSVVAWGLPLVPIIVLLSWDTDFYKSEMSNRGYCYPEGVAFQATVQGPAGIILIANLVIFIIILNHIYGWVKCNKDVVVRKHTADDRAAQLRNFANSVFVFFLFGFTWLFHFLSEEGIINSEFLFEFMFLITASFHLFMLSLFFIVLDKKTRTMWIKTLGKKRT